MTSFFRRYRSIALLIFAFAIPSIALAGGFWQTVPAHFTFEFFAGANGGDQIEGITFKDISTGDDVNVNGVPTLKQSSGDWSISSNGCLGAHLTPGGTCTVYVEFAPTSVGKQRAAVSVTAVDLTTGHQSTASAHLVGTGS
jgi:hypothetical protein